VLTIPCRSGYASFPARLPVRFAAGEFLSNHTPKNVINRAIGLVNDGVNTLHVFPCTFTIAVPQFKDLRFRCPRCNEVRIGSLALPRQETYIICMKCTMVWVSIVLDKKYEPYARPWMDNIEPTPIGSRPSKGFTVDQVWLDEIA